jgi:hypothetical protein
MKKMSKEEITDLTEKFGKIAPKGERWEASEEAMQKMFTAWMRRKSNEHLLYVHIPNEGRHKVQFRAKQISMGMKTGMPDVMIFDDIPEMHFKGLAIELKRSLNKPSEKQLECLVALKEKGWLCYWTNSLEIAKDLVNKWYHRETVSEETVS